MRYPISNRSTGALHPSRTQIQENPKQSANINMPDTPINNAYNSQLSTLSSSTGPALPPAPRPTPPPLPPSLPPPLPPPPAMGNRNTINNGIT